MQVWCYEFLGMFVPENKYKDQSVIPRGLKWQKVSKGKREGGKDLEAYRAFLDGLREDQVSSHLCVFHLLCPIPLF